MYANPCGLQFWDFALLTHFFGLLNPFLHETSDIGPTVSNQYCYSPVVEIRSGIEECGLLELSENQEMMNFQDLDNEIDILLYQNAAEKSIKMLKPIFD